LTSFPHLKRLKPTYNLATKNFLLTTATMKLAVYTLLLQAAQRIATIDKFLSLFCALRPIHLLLTVVLSTAMVTFYLLHRPRTVYLVDYACFTARETHRSPKASFLEHMHLSTSFSDSTINFIERVLELSGMGEETWVPSACTFLYRAILQSG
jgi:3-ketoacyl-CoA synthase